jgi:hypothetical protein
MQGPASLNFDLARGFVFIPLALAESSVSDRDGRIDQLDALVQAATMSG